LSNRVVSGLESLVVVSRTKDQDQSSKA